MWGGIAGRWCEGGKGGGGGRCADPPPLHSSIGGRRGKEKSAFHIRIQARYINQKRRVGEPAAALSSACTPTPLAAALRSVRTCPLQL